MQTVRIGTRGSALALWQANHVAKLLAEHHPEVHIEIVPIKTEGDRRLDVSLAELGGKGLFVKELENALHDKRIDVAVHSMKDVTVHLPPQFCIPVILDRASPNDAFVSTKYRSVAELPRNAVVGTCSLRRKSQLLHLRSDLNFFALRGNVPTRLRRLDDGEFDAIILAVSGLRRLGLEDRITQELHGRHHIPSPGQGALGIECRSEDISMRELIAPLNHEQSRIAVDAERITNRQLGGSCIVPIGIHATIDGEQLVMSASIGTVDGRKVVWASIDGFSAEYEAMAMQLAERLLEQGAEEILNAFESE